MRVSLLDLLSRSRLSQNMHERPSNHPFLSLARMVLEQRRYLTLLSSMISSFTLAGLVSVGRWN
jgi:hypothetical protein